MSELDQLPAAESIDPGVNFLASRIIAVPEASDDAVKDINARFALAPLTADQIFTFRGTISTDAPDSYFTEMDPETTLRNFVEDFSAGQSLLDSHNSYQSAAVLGQSFRAVMENIKEAEGQKASVRVLVDWYMTRDAGTEVPIARVLAGTLRRQSVGFGGNDMEIISKQDGKPLYESDYYPGMRLPGDLGRATFIVKHGRGMEGSLVFKNSTPGAVVEKDGGTGSRIGAIVARVAELAQRGDIPREDAAQFSARWGVRFALPSRAGVFDMGVRTGTSGTRQETEGAMTNRKAGGIATVSDTVFLRTGKKFSAENQKRIEELAGKSGEVRDGLMELITAVVEEVEEEKEKDRTVTTEQVRAVTLSALADAGLTIDRAAPDLAAAIRALSPEIARLREDAKDGALYRQSIIDTALAEGARAFGAAQFDKVARKATLESMPLASVKELSASWTEIGDKRLGGGRSTTEPEPEQIDGQPARRVASPIVPLSAYRISG